MVNRGTILRTGGLVLAGVAAVVVLAWPRPSTRKYPNREPVVFWHQWTGEWKDVVDGIVADFNRSQNKYELLALSVPGSASTKTILGVIGGRPPDVLAQWEAVIPTWAEKGLIQPFDPLLTPEEKAIYDREAYPPVKKMGQVKGKIYSLVPTMNQWAIYIRTDHLKEAGLRLEDFPTTLDGVVEWGKKLDKFDKDGSLVRMGYTPGSWANLIPLFGGRLWRWDRPEGGLTLDDPKNLQALQWLVNERKRYGYDRVARFQSGMGGDFGASWSFIVGQQSMVVEGQWRVQQLSKFGTSIPYAVRPIPPPPGGKTLAGFTNGNQMVIPAKAQNPKGAIEFVKFWSGLSDPERAVKHLTVGGWLPMLRSVTRSKGYQKYIKDHPEFAQFVRLMDSPNTHPHPPVAYQQIIQDKLGKAQDSALRGTVTPAEAVRGLKSDIEKEVERRRRLGYE